MESKSHKVNVDHLGYSVIRVVFVEVQLVKDGVRILIEYASNL